jgi:hypothetical protein
MKFRVFKEGLGGAQMRRCNFDSTLRTKSFQIWVEFHKFGVDQRGLETHSKCLYWANMLRFSGSCPQSVAETRWCRLFELGIRRVILRGGKNRGIDVFSNSESSSKTLLWTTHLHFESTMLIYHRTVQQPLQLDNCYCDSTRTWNESTKSHAPEKFYRLVCGWCGSVESNTCTTAHGSCHVYSINAYGTFRLCNLAWQAPVNVRSLKTQWHCHDIVEQNWKWIESVSSSVWKQSCEWEPFWIPWSLAKGSTRSSISKGHRLDPLKIG